MKIIVNTRLLISHKLSGLGWFTFHTLQRMVKAHPEHQFIFLFDRPYEEQFIFGPNVIPEVAFPPTRHPLLVYLWLEYALPGIFKKHKPDAFFSPDGFLSLKMKEIPSVPVIHDLNFEHYPSDLPFADRTFYKRYIPKYARMARRIITVSEFSKNDINRLYHIPLDKIDVAYNGASEIFAPVSVDIKQQIKSELTANCDFFVAIGDLLPRKNIARLLQAYELFKDQTGSNVKLVIVGQKLFHTSEIERTYQQSKYRDEIVFTGRLSNEKLKEVLASALSLVYVSYFEGFGIPLVEAMYADVPVITSNVTAMPEVAGNAALLVDPFSTNSIADAMQQIFKDGNLRTELINKGRLRRESFHWDHTAMKIWQSIEKAVNA
ncbi:MAG TPA: glycosyltransferase family 1 protein [Bacteroidales bacterium]|nr:glycosyltransferase family 1 protein [Bacteroidales bacterium]